ncbi:[NiFe]-hydrogenase assembly chaperone HybE [Ovoidimarina sediminis]|uniref:[NiFe]-hydrogenase assembly chaperone HybE n=1 Tax=Ovoidimarina sediminis TaxID=3079856 RepID=UPI002910F7ED|nr:[NiFe]-hydrogenase assembly chaperone HybE [Rhodophyticola sp. MJ-SS7]MDU8945446.1 [NiFe]-hydrogenase assembly chaperone HybE [Rhodophyticola sp. MJ-SS7]
MTRFEGSFLGAAAKISPHAIMECKICWTPYDPVEGDDFRQVSPGTAFTDLPGDWSCPTCSAPKEQFMVLEDPGSQAFADEAVLRDATGRLVADFTEVWHSTMRGVPLANTALHVEAVGFRRHEGMILGVLVSPWFMNLILMPNGEDWSRLAPGTREVIRFPSGDYEFLHNSRELTGGYKACSLFSPMGDFNSQKDATDVAEAVMTALFDPTHRAETDRAADIRARRVAELTPEEAPADPTPSRRAVITGGLAAKDTAV